MLSKLLQFIGDELNLPIELDIPLFSELLSFQDSFLFSIEYLPVLTLLITWSLVLAMMCVNLNKIPDLPDKPVKQQKSKTAA